MLSTVLGLIALGAMPALASAAHNDSFSDAIRVNGRGTALGGSFSHAHSNVGATVDPDPFPDGDFPWACGPSWYGANTWYWFFPHANGRVHLSVRTGGPAFTEPFIGTTRWAGTDTSPTHAGGGVCVPVPEQNRAELLDHPVAAGDWWAIEVGGIRTPNTETGTPDTGDYELVLNYDPDSDGDGLLDSRDECDGEPGPAAHAGCPDNDGDNIPNRSDACPSQAGTPTFQGCPDADGDGIPENGSDKCTTVNPSRVSRNDRNRDGCPDLVRTDRLVGVRMNVGRLASGIRMRSFVVTGVPNGARVVVTCKLPSGRRCGGVRVRRAATGAVLANAARRITVKSLRNKRLPFRTSITVRVTARYATGKFIRLRVVNTGARINRTDFCMREGSNKLRKRGCA